MRNHVTQFSVSALAVLWSGSALAAGSGMPWEAPLTQILESIEGPGSLFSDFLAFDFLPGLSSKPNYLGQFTASGRIFRSHHRIVRRQPPFLAIFVR